MRNGSMLCLSVLAMAACGGKKPPPVDAATSPPPAEDTAKAPVEDTAKAPVEDTAKAADAAAPADPELLKRGTWVATTAGCVLCHTQVGEHGPVIEKEWAGGLEITEAFGTWRSPNISQDKKTGIGGWTDQEIINAVREGKRPDGAQLYPIMPYQFYNVMSDGDAKALVAFLRTLPAIENAVTGNDLKLPKPPAPKAAGTEPANDPVHKGQYITMLMHCGACHTPMGPEGPDMSKWLAGGPPMEFAMLGEGTLYPGNLTPHPTTGIGAWSEADIIASLRTLKRKDGTPILGPMMFFADVFAKMAEEDIAAIAAYLKSLPPVDNAVPKSTFKLRAPPPGAPPAPGADAGTAPEKGDAKP